MLVFQTLVQKLVEHESTSCNGNLQWGDEVAILCSPTTCFLSISHTTAKAIEVVVPNTSPTHCFAFYDELSRFRDIGMGALSNGDSCIGLQKLRYSGLEPKLYMRSYAIAQNRVILTFVM